jgi:hypothetical protein
MVLSQGQKVCIGELPMTNQCSDIQGGSFQGVISSRQNTCPGIAVMRRSISIASRGATASRIIFGFEEILTKPCCVMGHVAQKAL